MKGAWKDYFLQGTPQQSEPDPSLHSDRSSNIDPSTLPTGKKSFREVRLENEALKREIAMFSEHMELGNVQSIQEESKEMIKRGLQVAKAKLKKNSKKTKGSKTDVGGKRKLSAFEKRRNEKVKRNRAHLKNMGFEIAAGELVLLDGDSDDSSSDTDGVDCDSNDCDSKGDMNKSDMESDNGNDNDDDDDNDPRGTAIVEITNNRKGTKRYWSSGTMGIYRGSQPNLLREMKKSLFLNTFQVRTIGRRRVKNLTKIFQDSSWKILCLIGTMDRDCIMSCVRYVRGLQSRKVNDSHHTYVITQCALSQYVINALQILFETAIIVLVLEELVTFFREV